MTWTHRATRAAVVTFSAVDTLYAGESALYTRMNLFRDYTVMSIRTNLDSDL
jgi:hypothetical protein